MNRRGKCKLTLAGPDVERKREMETATRPTEVDVHYDKLCAVCRYPIDNQGLCLMDAEHAGV